MKTDDLADDVSQLGHSKTQRERAGDNASHGYLCSEAKMPWLFGNSRIASRVPEENCVSAPMPYGRGGTVGRGRGVGVALGEGCIVAVGVADALAVAVAVAVGAGDAGLGVGEADPHGLTGQLKISIEAMMFRPAS